MKRKKLIRRGLSLVLTLVMALGCLWPSLVTRAAEFSIDGTGFEDPTIDHTTLYIWRRGLPAANRNADVGRKRDVLLVWDGMYYLKCTPSFTSKMVDMYPMTSGGNHKLKVGHLGLGLSTDFWTWDGINWDTAGNITWRNGWFPYDGTNGWNKGSRYYPNGYPHGYYMYTVDYGSSAGLVSSLPLRYETMATADIAGTLEPISDLPFSAYVGKADGTPIYGLGIKAMIGGATRDVWVASEHKIHTWNDDHWYTSDDQYTYIRASLGYWNAGEKFAANGSHSLADSAWQLVPGTGKQVSVETVGEGFTAKYNDDGFADNEDKDDLYNLYHGHLFGYMSLAHSGSTFRTVGNAKQWTYSYKYDYGSPGGKSPYLSNNADQFDVYWCEEKIMDFLQVDFSVQNGQVSNLDGPMAIANNTVITVKDGGTLTISGWVANNGTIKVERGGTLYIQKDACVCRLNDGRHNGGGIISEGLVIVDENAKLCGGGVDGIQLKDGCHVVNYGLVSSENFSVTNSYTIENRAGGVVFSGAGNGVTGSGMGTWQNSVGPEGYMERGKVEDVCYVNMADNAVYNN